MWNAHICSPTRWVRLVQGLQRVECVGLRTRNAWCHGSCSKWIVIGTWDARIAWDVKAESSPKHRANTAPRLICGFVAGTYRPLALGLGIGMRVIDLCAPRTDELHKSGGV